MGDRELLEWAAKAHGDLDWKSAYGSGAWSPRGTWRIWNPLKDDGDRYRLIAKLKMSIDFKECTVWYRRASGELIQEFWGGDCGDEAHAVLRAAAEIGKATAQKGVDHG